MNDPTTAEAARIATRVDRVRGVVANAVTRAAIDQAHREGPAALAELLDLVVRISVTTCAELDANRTLPAAVRTFLAAWDDCDASWESLAGPVKAMRTATTTADQPQEATPAPRIHDATGNPSAYATRFANLARHYAAHPELPGVNVYRHEVQIVGHDPNDAAALVAWAATMINPTARIDYVSDAFGPCVEITGCVGDQVETVSGYAPALELDADADVAAGDAPLDLEHLAAATSTTTGSGDE